MSNQKQLSPIAEKKEFRIKLLQFYWVFDRVGIQHSIREKLFDDFVTKVYKRYKADYKQLSEDLTRYRWLLTEKHLSKILGEIHTKMEEHRFGMEVRNGITGWMPKRAWGICINEIVLPKFYDKCKHFPNDGIKFLFHSIVSRFRHWRDSQQLKIDYERLHPGINFEELIENDSYEKWQLKELDAVAERNRKRFEEKDQKLLQIYGVTNHAFLQEQEFNSI